MQSGDSVKLLYDLWNLKVRANEKLEDVAGAVSTQNCTHGSEGKRKVAQSEIPLDCYLIALNNILPRPHIQDVRSSDVAIHHFVVSLKKSKRKCWFHCFSRKVRKERLTKTKKNLWISNVIVHVHMLRCMLLYVSWMCTERSGSQIWLPRTLLFIIYQQWKQIHFLLNSTKWMK